jgi:predicted metal-dependent phosphoesterase TrpH
MSPDALSPAHVPILYDVPTMSETAWSAADLHIHSTVSDGTATPREILEWVRDETDLAVIAITDHNSNAGGLEAARIAVDEGIPVDVIVGQEVESTAGHIIGLWTPELVRPGMSACDTVDAIHDQGGFAIAAHPYAPRMWAKAGLDRGDTCTYDTTEYDGFEIANSTPLLFVANWWARAYWRRNADRLACTGGSDAHILSVIGTSRTLFPGSTAEDLRLALEERTTKVTLPGFSPRRNFRYARRVPEIMARDRDRKTREIAAGIREESAGTGTFKRRSGR